ncbi:MAG: glutamate--tRNA ligase [Alphaproteobacteria bacterium]|nr:glutamate--tRNA ligase [Alphaproteobacteria bacterium]
MIVVRFAPSPTGYMHIGNLRTALLNYLYALNQKAKGEEIKFVLRMDDTDTVRSKIEYENAVYECLNWMGMKWDRLEHQSKRLDRYHEVLEQLKKQGRVYACYETAEELEYKRNRLLHRKLPPIYDREGMRLTQEQIKAYETEGRRPHYRFVLEHNEMAWDDIVRGHCSYQGQNLSDPIIVREDGTFPYMLPSVIDDIDFGITHIIRGEDHVTNTAVQIQMFKALGAPVPVFGHPPLLTGKEGKLSKRTGSVSFRELRADGIEPMTIACLLAKLGTSVAPVIENSLEKLAPHFDLADFGRAQPHFDTDDLFKLNPRIVHALDLKQVNDRLKAQGKSEITEAFWNAVSPNLAKVDDVELWSDICNNDHVYKLDDADREFVRQTVDLLPQGEFDENSFSTWTSKIKEQTGKKGKDLFHPLRLALTGLEQGPELKMLLPLMGREKVVARLKG